MRGLIAVLLTATLIMGFLYAVAQPTPQERASMLDKLGPQTTGRNWQ